MKKALVLVIIVALLITLSAMILPLTFGSPMKSDMDDYFLRFGQEQTGTNNQCTSVTFDFRGFDTLGESTVLFTAVIGAGLMFRRLAGGEENEDE
ncbi:MAG: hydrogen gas-evolving membrane-bound hydrogenase subunit E [Methanolinea sp.]